MSESATAHPAPPSSGPAPTAVWYARGRSTLPLPDAVVRRHLRQMQDAAVVDAHLELDPAEIPYLTHPSAPSPASAQVPAPALAPRTSSTAPAPDAAGPAVTDHGVQSFEARWRAPDGTTVRARLTIGPEGGFLPGAAPGLTLAPAGLAHALGRAPEGREWLLVAEAESAWDPRWPSPADMFWPREAADGWDCVHVGGMRGVDLRTLEINRLPDDDKELRKLLKDCARDGWNIHVVVHEAMTPDARGLRPLVRRLPAGLRHRVIEHRAAPDQYRAVNWALKDHGIEVPRGGAVVLPGDPPRPGYDRPDFTVRTVFLDGSEPTALIDALHRFAALPAPLPEGAAEGVRVMREQWHLVTLQERLAHAERLVVMYKEALEAMTRSRDLYREAAEQAHEALAALRASAGPAALPAPRPEAPADGAGPPSQGSGFSLRQLTRSLERMKDAGKARRERP
ncbi:hypothetical protein [Streptomyces chilikensis]|uniref:hypothetical protein n=1 Tax=Streptomyces chilikensis TaxID=1194079 RepID=UPI001407B005|nr:hypothetical protein [Streptomyces chilikensis]